MPPLLVDQTIEIPTRAASVWNALTQRPNTDQWAAELSRGGPSLHIESDWQLGSPVLWKDPAGAVLVDGAVTALDPGRLLRFTVHARSPRPLVAASDGITFELSEQDGSTTLRLRHGDFSTPSDGETFRDLGAQKWARVLPIIKALAEAGDMAQQPTCGKGLAANAVLPALFGQVLAATAENLDLHLLAIDTGNDAGRQERDAYLALVAEHRQLAAALEAAARHMASYRGLPPANHHDEVWADPRFRQAFETLVEREQALLALLQQRAAGHQQMLTQMRAAAAPAAE
jgi:uncharacterized protein YndB with AHSA1/START domain